MSKPIQIQFGINSYKTKSGLLSAERLVNFYAEPAPESSPFRGMLKGTSGLTVWKNLNQFEPIYGSIEVDEYLYVVCGLNFYQIDSSKNTTLRGTLGGSPDRVMMTNNRTQITILTNNGDSYYFDTGSNTFAKITDADYQSASSVTTLNHYSIFTKQSSDQFFISALNDTTSYSALDFATAEVKADDLVRAYAVNNELWLFGTQGTEIWQNTGNATFPFERIVGAYIEVGCAAKFSVVNDQEGLFWLGDDYCVYQNQGYAAKKISTYPIDEEIRTY
ncbi:MAG TPA: packaged DNA stabilization protein, partial [Allocoleopsis sp.]